MGRLNATWPFATLELSGASLKLAIVPGRLFGVKPLSAGPSAVALAFPVRGRFGAVGIAIRPPAFPDSYFWTHRQTEVLAALAEAGFPVSWEEQRIGPGDTAPVTARNGWAGVLGPHIPLSWRRAQGSPFRPEAFCSRICSRDAPE